MKKTIIFLLLVIGWAKHASAQTNRVNYGTTTYTWTAGPPTGAPSSTGAKWAVDTATLRVYAWDNSAWTFTGHNVEPISGCSTPAYTPGKGDSWVVINNCSTPEIYSWSGTAWRKAGGTDYIAGPGISISGTTITNTGDLSNTNELQTISTGTNTLTLSNGGGTVTVDTDPASDVTGSGANGQVSFWTGAQTQNGDNGLFWNNTTKRLGIGTNTPGQLLDIVSSGQSLLRIKGGTGTNQGSAHYFTAAGSSLTLFAYGDEAAIVGGTPDQSAMFFTNAGIPLKFRLGGSSVSAFTFTANGRLLAGTQTDDGFRLNIVGDSRFADNLSIGTTSSAARLHVVGSGSTSSTWTAQFHNSAGNNNALMIRNDGNVGIGTNTLQAKLHVTGNVYVPTGFRYMGGGNATNAGMSFWGTQDGNTGWGGFMGRNMYYDGTNYYYSSTNANSLWGTVAGLWVQGNSLNTIALGLIARPPTEEGLNVISTNTDRLAYMRLAVTYSGNIGINNTNPSARLHVVGSGSTSSTWTAQFHNSAGNNNALMIRDDGNIGVRTNAPTDLIDINGANGYSQLRLRTAYTPTGTADANGNTGDVAWDADYIYIKTAAGWKRSALSTF